jgi:hypothetical protein
VFYYVIGGAAAAVAGWYAVATAWASSVAKHQPDLRDMAQTRYGWRCTKCGYAHTPTCKAGDCGGPLVWVQQGTRIKCARCHRYFVAHPMLFRQTPRPRRMFCSKCKSVVMVKEFKVS